MKKDKRLSLLINIIVVITFAFAGCSVDDDSSPSSPLSYLTIDVDVDKNVYYIGETVTVFVQATQDCYLTLYDISTQGEVSQIFPNQFASDNLLRGGETYRIPAEADEFDFEITGPPGTEEVQATCVTPDSEQQAEDTVTFEVVW